MPGRVDLWWTAATLAAVVAVVSLVSPDNVPVVLPLLACGAVGASLFCILWRRRDGTAALCEIGALYAAVVLMYTLFPLVGFLAGGLRYAATNDGRLYVLQPAPWQIGRVGWYGTVHLLAFVVAYLAVRGRLPRRPPRFERPDRALLIALILCYAVIQLFLVGVARAYGLSAGSYAETYLLASRLPLPLAQLSNHLGGARLVLEVALLAALFADYARYRLVIAAWLLFQAVTTFSALGSRTSLVLACLSSALMYHYLVRPIRVSRLAAGAAAVLGAFVLLGLLRGGFLQGGLPASMNVFAYASEFEVIFANAVHLDMLDRARTLAPPSSLYISDLLALVPQQFAPITKVTPSEWYVTTYFPMYAASGGGLAFGTIAESIIGWGWIDLIARGAALGLLLGVVHRTVVLHRRGFWMFVLYIWLSVQIYHSFRNTTFTLLPLFVYRFVPTALACAVIAEVIRALAGVPERRRLAPPLSGDDAGTPRAAVTPGGELR